MLLTGDEPVPTARRRACRLSSRTGAKATHAQAVEAMRKHLIDLRSDLPNARGAGYDQRTGEVVLLVTRADADKFGLDAIRARAEQVSGVRVRVIINELNEFNMSIDGGGRVEGLNLQTNRRNLCTTAFVITNGETNAITTAAHCPDELTYVDRDGTTVDAADDRIVGRGLSRRADQRQPGFARPLVLFEPRSRNASPPRQLAQRREHARRRLRLPLWRKLGLQLRDRRAHRLCAAGDLCGGPCFPTWVTVKGPNCVRRRQRRAGV